MRRKKSIHFLWYFLSLLLMILIFPGRSLAQLTSQGNEQVITYSGATAFVLTQQPVNPNLLVTTGTNTFIMAVNPPTNAARVYVTNDTANACSNLTVSLASTGNSALNSFNNNPQAWQTVNVQAAGGGFGSTAPITLPASGTVAITSQPIIGSRIAVFVVLSSACLTTTVDVQVVFGTFTPAIGAVQGVTPQGVAGSGIAPVLVGGLDASGLSRTYKACADSSSTTCVASPGYDLPIGAGGNTIAGVFQAALTAITLPNASAGPLAVVNGAEINNAVSGMTPLEATGGNSQNHSGTANPTALFETRSGLYFRQTNTNITATTNVAINPVAVFTGNFSSCFVTVNATLVSGTTPTLNVYFQTGADGTTYTDRISFTQFAATGNQFAGIAGGGTGITPTIFTSGTLAAGTKIDGPIGPFLNIRFVAGGTTPNWTALWAVACY